MCQQTCLIRQCDIKGGLKITKCGVYRLVECITYAPCEDGTLERPRAAITICSSDVVLDLGGFTLDQRTGVDGTPTHAHVVGILIEGVENVTVLNGTLDNFATAGILAKATPYCRLREIKIENIKVNNFGSKGGFQYSGVDFAFAAGIAVLGLPAGGVATEIILRDVIVANSRGSIGDRVVLFGIFFNRVAVGRIEEAGMNRLGSAERDWSIAAIAILASRAVVVTDTIIRFVEGGLLTVGIDIDQSADIVLRDVNVSNVLLNNVATQLETYSAIYESIMAAGVNIDTSRNVQIERSVIGFVRSIFVQANELVQKVIGINIAGERNVNLNDVSIDNLQHEAEGDSVFGAGIANSASNVTIEGVTIKTVNGPDNSGGGFGIANFPFSDLRDEDVPVRITGLLIENTEVVGVSSAAYFFSRVRGGLVKNTKAIRNEGTGYLTILSRLQLVENHAIENVLGFVEPFTMEQMPEKLKGVRKVIERITRKQSKQTKAEDDPVGIPVFGSVYLKNLAQYNLVTNYNVGATQPIAVWNINDPFPNPNAWANLDIQ